MRTQIEKWLLITILAANFLIRAPGLIQQGLIGLPALVVGFTIAAVLIALLLKHSAKAALLIACLSALGLAMILITTSLGGSVPRGPGPSGLAALPPLVALFCAIDVWSVWSKKRPPAAP